jgi:hypothetical protein
MNLWKISHAALAAVLTAAATAASAGDAGLSAAPCRGCTDDEFETAAIARGPGLQYLYDADRDELRRYLVRVEPNDRGGRSYEAQRQVVEKPLAALMQEGYMVRADGTLGASLVLDLAKAAEAGKHANDSVFDVATSPHHGANVFGAWLGAYMASRGIPVSGADDDAQAKLRQANPAMQFPPDRKRQYVTVKFKDGRAAFVLEADEETYQYQPRTGIDEEGHVIPSSAQELAQGSPWRFRQGADGSAAKGFARFVEFLQYPSPTKNWHCEATSRGYTCRFTPDR